MSILNIKDLVEKVRAKACSGIVEDQTFIAEFCVLCDFATAAEAKLSTLRDELARSESATPDKHPDTERPRIEQGSWQVEEARRNAAMQGGAHDDAELIALAALVNVEAVLMAGDNAARAINGYSPAWTDGCGLMQYGAVLEEELRRRREETKRE